mmetsp:Transcript_121520/g.340317  ORF Transcript_121520/g.340317 Transcript_121520/m.340317 type:complete len:586 (-) Transcript_121520:214-1971(-)
MAGTYCCAAGDSDNDELPTIANQQDRRMEMLDGLPIKRVDFSVPPAKRKAIAIARTAIMGLAFVGAGVGVYFAAHHMPTFDQMETSKLVLKLDLCAPKGPHLVGNSTGLDDGLQSVLRTKSHKVFQFMPVTKYAVPSVTYYESEEMYPAPNPAIAAYSLTMFGMRAIQFDVDIGDDVSCLSEGGDVKMDDQVERAENRFGAAIVDQLMQSDRRTPRATMPLVPMSHGGMLIRKNDKRMWSLSLERFEEVYHESTAMLGYRWIMRILTVFGTALVTLVAASTAFHSWWKATESWVLQYDFLWEASGLQSIGARGAIDYSKVDVKKLAHSKQSWQLGHVCGVFWVLDFAVGDPIANTERWIDAIQSGCFNASSMIALAFLPILHASFFEGWRIPVYCLVGMHFLQTFGFGAAYFFQVNPAKRQGFYYGYLCTASALLLYSMCFMVAVVLFLSTRLVVMPHEAGGAVGAFGAVGLYSVALVVGLRYFRHRVMSRMVLGRQSKGQLSEALASAGLDNRSLALAAIRGPIFVGLTGVMLILVGDLYFENGGASQFFAIFVMSGLGIASFLRQMHRRYEAVLQMEGDVGDY